ncbi:unnamed protein product [Prunus brigantina]
MRFPKFWTQFDIDWSTKLDNSRSLDFTQNQLSDSSHHFVVFPKFWTQSDIDWSMRLDNSGSYEVHSEMESLVYRIFWPLAFTQNRPKDSYHHIMWFPKFWTQSDIDWSMKLDNSCSHEILDFTQNPPNHYTHHIMMFPKFLTQSDIDWSMKLDNSGSYKVRSEMGSLVDWFSLKTHQMTPPTVLCCSPIHSEMEWLVYCIVLEIGFHSKPAKSLLPPYSDVPQVLDSIRYRLVHEIGQFRFFWTQSDIDWSVKLENSGSYEVRSEVESLSLVYCIVFVIGFHLTLNKLLLPPYYDVPHVLDFIRYRLVQAIGQFRFFWTQSDIDWSMKSDNSGQYEVRSEMGWLSLVYCIILEIGFHSKYTKSLLPPYFVVPQVLDSIQYRMDHEIGQFRFRNGFWTQSDIDWSMKSDNSHSYEVRSEIEWLVYCIVLAIGLHSKSTK